MANIIGPLITNIDRFLIGILISATAVAYYATPYEVITKLLLIPSALVAVLFPAFSASFFSNQEVSKKLFYSGIKFIFLILYPIIFVIVTFAHQGIELWLGVEFAKESSVILQILAIGILFNSISYVPFNYFQGVGKPSIPAVINLIELPVYLFLMYIFIQNWGIKGAAYIWLLRIVLDSGIMFLFAYKKFDIKFGTKFEAGSFIIFFFCLLLPFFIENLYSKIIYSVVFLTCFIILAWKEFISSEEKNFLISRIKQLN